MWQLWLLPPLQPLRCSVARTIASPHERVKTLFLPFPGLSWAFSERCWPLSPQSAPSPNSTLPFCYVSIFGCGTEGNKSKNYPLDRYCDYWRKIINVLGWNNSSTLNGACVVWKMYLEEDVSARRKLSSTISELLFAHPWQRRRMRTVALKGADAAAHPHSNAHRWSLCCFYSPVRRIERIIRVRLKHSLELNLLKLFRNVDAPNLPGCEILESCYITRRC